MGTEVNTSPKSNSLRLSDMLLLLLPLALQPAVDFGLSKNTSSFFPIYHQLSPSSHSQRLKISFYFFSPIISWVFLVVSSLTVLEWTSFWASYPPPFSSGDPANLSFAPLSILLYLELYANHVKTRSNTTHKITQSSYLSPYTNCVPSADSHLATSNTKWNYRHEKQLFFASTNLSGEKKTTPAEI
jgi:hypothetical protein